MEFVSQHSLLVSWGSCGQGWSSEWCVEVSVCLGVVGWCRGCLGVRDKVRSLGVVGGGGMLGRS
eukprot:8786827-Heterocapsa_arctica.AAC.1